MLQHEENILLRQRQVSALKSLLQQPKDGRFKESIEKIIPGGGKTGVLIPILVEEKAQGDNLVLVEVPQALLATNHVGFNRTSQRLFGKRAYRFEFNRDSNSTPERLEQIYHLFTEVMTTRSYLVTTGEAIQSLELKYIELLSSNGVHDDIWKQQVYWVEKINQLLHHHTDCIIDEVHQGLSLKKKLNYTSGEPRPLHSSIIKNATALFGFIDMTILKEAPSFDEAYDWTPFKKDLATKIITHSSSPLNAFVVQATIKYGLGVQEELLAYLTDQATTISEAILNAHEDDKAALAFFKQEITVMLPQTLTQQLYKHYGPSKRENVSSIERTLAIPYAASNVPNERNRFANEIESMNKTIQMMLIKGISKEQLSERITEWQTLARQELFQNSTLTHLDETATAQGFALIASTLGLKLSQVSAENQAQIDALHQCLQFNTSLIFDFLQEFTLKHIQQDRAIIPSDNFNHADQYRSVQGLSGTPSWNDTSYHQRLSHDKRCSLGTDGYILEVIRNKKTPVSSVDYDEVPRFIKTIISQSKAQQHTRAIIDIKGTFTGVNNASVAREIATYLKNNQYQFSQPLKQVIYFDDDQILCAIDINNPGKPIILKTSDTRELNRLLDSTPEQRFTYYDQLHTLGTDITQEEQANAIVLVDDKTSLQSFLQGNMRQRMLDQSQTIELVVPTRLDGMSLQELCSQFLKNDKQTIVMDAPSAAKEQMKNHIRRMFLSLIQDLPSEEAEKKAELIQHFKPFFENSPSLDLFALYGGINKKQTIEDILDHYKSQLEALWKTCLKSANMSMTEADIQQMNQVLQKIIDRAIPFCLKEYKGQDNPFATEVEVQKEVQKEVEIEVLSLNETYNADLVEKQQLNWRALGRFRNLDELFLNVHTLNTLALPLNSVCKHGDVEPTVFSNQLLASRNYAETYDGQKEYTGVYLKPVFLIWYHLHHDGLNAMIVTPQEAKELGEYLNDSPSSWLSTTQDTLISGKRPDGILLDTRYQTLREQVRFFNGEFTSLLNQEAPLIWLNEQTVEKMRFFEDTLLPYRPGSAADLHQFRAVLNKSQTEGFVYIAGHPFEDLSHFDWLKQYPNTMNSQVAEYKKVAAAFLYLNHNWESETIIREKLQQQFYLSLNNLSYVDKHFNHLMALKPIVARLNRLSEQPFILNLSDEERSVIETCIGIPIHRLYELRQLTEPNTGKTPSDEELQSLSLISIQVLNMLQSYPAFQNKKDLLTSHFEEKAKQATSKEILRSFLYIDKPTEALIQNIIEHPLFDNDLTHDLFQLKIDLTEDLFIILLKNCKTNLQIDSLLKQEGLSETMLQTILSQNSLTEDHLLNILARAKSDATMALIRTHSNATQTVRNSMLQHPLLSSHLLLTMLTTKPFTDDECLLVLKHPTAVTQDVLEEMLKNESINSDLIIEMAQVAHNTALIDALLARPEMTCDIADILFQKKEYSGKIDHWDWLTEQQLLSTLQTTSDYVSLHSALTHPHLSSTARQHWLEKVVTQHKENQRLAGLSKGPLDKLQCSLEALKIKSYTHAIKALHHKKYEDVSITAFGLYQTLNTAFENYKRHPDHPHANEFKMDSQKAIEKAKPILEVHRGYKQILLDIINIILSFAALFKKGSWRFFKAKTASEQIANTISEQIDETTQDDQPQV
jgi:hypothetical protein